MPAIAIAIAITLLLLLTVLIHVVFVFFLFCHQRADVAAVLVVVANTAAATVCITHPGVLTSY